MSAIKVNDYAIVLVDTEHYKIKGSLVQVENITPEDDFPIFVKCKGGYTGHNCYTNYELEVVTPLMNPEYFI